MSLCLVWWRNVVSGYFGIVARDGIVMFLFWFSVDKGLARCLGGSA